MNVIDPLLAKDHWHNVGKSLLDATNKVYFRLGDLSIPTDSTYAPTKAERQAYQKQVAEALHLIAGWADDLLLDFQPVED